MNKPVTVTPFLWFDTDLTEMVAFYGNIFSDFKVHNVNSFQASFELGGQNFLAGNFGPYYKFNEAISLFITCDGQAEVDTYWNALLADGGEPGRCGWLKDKYGISWQVVPSALGEALSNPDRELADYAQQAMMGMSKIIIIDLVKN
ncbi:MAG: hypothetical protein RL196_405 [Actinomycetota bacterium]|jgi:predicted 3-demethylubiquinone-9 3-methyltransferase (glyoxalase superfamily)